MSELRSQEQLKAAAHHLDYEYQMLMGVAQTLASGTPQGLITNALLESFVIHLRALIDFFYMPKRKKSDDMLATDYFPDPGEWTRIRPKQSEALGRAMERANKEIAHLTYARLDLTPETKPWKFLEIAREIESVMAVFLAQTRGRLL